MAMNASAFVPVVEGTQVAAARRSATDLARSLGFDTTDTGRVALVVTELATNLVKHAVSGGILLRGLSGSNGAGVEILAIDKGRGIADLQASLRDGYSTA